MTDADKAYAAAKAAIAEAKASGAFELDLSGFADEGIYKALDRLPPEIADLKDLKLLHLWRTQISDISALYGMTELTGLDLSHTPISDISALHDMTRLIVLDLSHTLISDISALQGMTTLTRLNLTGTQISDISALQGMTGLTELGLSGTQISDISVLQGMTGLTELGLSGTQISDADLPLLASLQNLCHLHLSGTDVLDLRPLQTLALLISPPSDTPWNGLHFKDTAATRLDPRIAEIAEIEDNAERARVLADYLKAWVPPPQPGDMPAPNATGLRYGTVEDGRLGYDLTSGKLAVTPEMDQLHRLLCEDTAEMLQRFPLGPGQDHDPLGRKLCRYQGALGQSAAAVMPVLMWKAGNDLRVLLRANRDRIGNSLGEMPYFGADLGAALEGLVATHNIFSAQHPDLSALDLAQIDPVDRARAEANRDLMAEFIEAMGRETRVILDYVVQDLRDLHSEARLTNAAGDRALRITEDSLRNMILQIVTQALIEQRQQSGVVTVLKDARAGLIGVAVATMEPDIVALYPQLAATIQPYLGTLLAGWHGKEYPVKQAVDWIVAKLKAGDREDRNR